jgi:hypothetical protein
MAYQAVPSLTVFVFTVALMLALHQTETAAAALEAS